MDIREFFYLIVFQLLGLLFNCIFVFLPISAIVIPVLMRRKGTSLKKALGTACVLAFIACLPHIYLFLFEDLNDVYYYLGAFLLLSLPISNAIILLIFEIYNIIHKRAKWKRTILIFTILEIVDLLPIIFLKLFGTPETLLNIFSSQN